jgi:hypothetical protein
VGDTAQPACAWFARRRRRAPAHSTTRALAPEPRRDRVGDRTVERRTVRRRPAAPCLGRARPRARRAATAHTPR